MSSAKFAAVYIRVSTTDQKDGLSLEVQEKLCRARAGEQGYEVLEVLDDGGISGHKEDRPGMNRIKELIREGKIGAVIALSSDRIFRNTKAHVELMHLVFQTGTRMIYINQADPENTASSIMTDSVLASVNQFYRDQVSDKVKATLYAKAKAGYFPTMPPAGYVNADNQDAGAERLARKIIVPDPMMGPLIKELFALYSTGIYSVYDLTDHMNDKGLRSYKGFRLAPSRVYDLLRNRLYLGEVHWGVIHVKGGKHEPLVDEATFNQVQMVLATHNQKACRKRKYEWLLAGFVFCHRHQKRYVAEWHHKKKRAYYHCPNRTGCGQYSEQTELEGKIADKFKDLQFSEEFVNLVLEKAKKIYREQVKKYGSRRQGAVNRKTALEGRRKVAEEKLLKGIISDADFSRIRAEINGDIERIDVEIEAIASSREVEIDIVQEILLLTRDIHSAYEKASFKLKRQYLAFFWDRFEVADGVILNSVSSPIFEELLIAEEAFDKSSESEKSPVLAGSSTGIFTNPLLPV